MVVPIQNGIISSPHFWGELDVEDHAFGHESSVRGCSTMVVCELPKLETRVRFSLPAPPFFFKILNVLFEVCFEIYNFACTNFTKFSNDSGKGVLFSKTISTVLKFSNCFLNARYIPTGSLSMCPFR